MLPQHLLTFNHFFELPNNSHLPNTQTNCSACESFAYATLLHKIIHIPIVSLNIYYILRKQPVSENIELFPQWIFLRCFVRLDKTQKLFSEGSGKKTESENVLTLFENNYYT